MKVFIPSKNRPETISTHRLFHDCERYVLVHNREQRDAYAAAGVPEAWLHVTDTEPDACGLTRQREWALKNLAGRDEWVCFADDNIRALTGVHGMLYHEETLSTRDGRGAKWWRDAFAREWPGWRFLDVVAPDCIAEAEQLGARLVGFSVTENPFFRGRKFRPVGYVIGKLMLWKHEPEFPWDHTVTMEDFRNTAEHLLRYGRVLVNNFLWPRAGHYEPGGMGTYDQRIIHRKRDVVRLLEQYPGLFRRKDRKGFVPGTELALRLHRPEQIDVWRRDLREERRRLQQWREAPRV